MISRLLSTVPASVWGWWLGGAVTAWSLPWMPDNTTRDTLIVLVTAGIFMGIREVYCTPGPEGA